MVLSIKRFKCQKLRSSWLEILKKIKSRWYIGRVVCESDWQSKCLLVKAFSRSLLKSVQMKQQCRVNFSRRDWSSSVSSFCIIKFVGFFRLESQETTARTFRCIRLASLPGSRWECHTHLFPPFFEPRSFISSRSSVNFQTKQKNVLGSWAALLRGGALHAKKFSNTIEYHSVIHTASGCVV